MDKLLKTYNLPRLNHEEKDSLNRVVRSKEVEVVIKNLPAKKSPEPDGVMAEFYQKINAELIV